MQTNHSEKQEQEDEQDEPIADEVVYDKENLMADGDKMGEMFPNAEYEIEVGQTTVTDNNTGDDYVVWKAVGQPVGVVAGEQTEVSPNLPEAIMGVCEALERNTGGL